MVALLWENVLGEVWSDIQRGRKGQSIHQSFDEIVAENRPHPFPFIENYGDAYDLVKSVLPVLYQNEKTKGFAKSLWYTLLMIARDRKSGPWVARVSLYLYMLFNELNYAKAFIPLLKDEKLSQQEVVEVLTVGVEMDYADFAPLFIEKLRILKGLHFNLNAKLPYETTDICGEKESEKLTLAEWLAKQYEPDTEEDSKGYCQMLEAARYHGADLIKAIPIAEEEENQEFVSFAMKLKLEQTTKDKPVVSRVSKDGGKV